MLKIISTTMLAATLATAAIAESTTMSRPIQAGSLHEGPLDMVAYWVPLDGDGYQLTATFIGRMPGNRPMRVVMKLEDGDDVSFSMPGYRTALYRFEREGDAVDASVAVQTNRVASR